MNKWSPFDRIKRDKRIKPLETVIVCYIRFLQILHQQEIASTRYGKTLKRTNEYGQIEISQYRTVEGSTWNILLLP
jgi:predicted transcriptional regulator